MSATITVTDATITSNAVLVTYKSCMSVNGRKISGFGTERFEAQGNGMTYHRATTTMADDRDELFLVVEISGTVRN